MTQQELMSTFPDVKFNQIYIFAKSLLLLKSENLKSIMEMVNLLQTVSTLELDESGSSLLNINDAKSLPKVDTGELEEATKQTKSVT